MPRERTVLCPICHNEVGVNASGHLRQHGDRSGQGCPGGGRSATGLDTYNTPGRLGLDTGQPADHTMTRLRA